MAAPRSWSWWRNDEQLAKKDDDLTLPGHPKHNINWQAARPRRRTRVKRFAAYLLVIGALFYLLSRRSSFASDIATAARREYDQRKRYPFDDNPSYPHGSARAEDGASSDGKFKPTGPKYDGPIKFPRLSSSLREVATVGGFSTKTRNVLFAAASLKSASTLLPMACDMAAEHRSSVHFAFVGLTNVALKELAQVNGVDDSCLAMLHDARPDHFEESSEHRMSLVTKAAFHLMDAYMHPRAVIVDSSSDEESYFLRSARLQVLSTESSATLIELPKSPRTSLSWITKLDSASLSAWNKVRFDILIYAPPTGTANLKRLLRSLGKANLAGLQTPRITIEIPHVVEPSLEEVLAAFKWPPPSPGEKQQPQLISLRRRITRHRLEEEESSVRFVESYWPTDPSSSHVLVLSAHTEITPQFFQYVQYSLLYQLHSRAAATSDYDLTMMGMSLSVPDTLVDGTSGFTPPLQRVGDDEQPGQTAFLWQRPSSEAMLFLGSKWIELHHFVSRRLSHQKPTAGTFATRASGKKYPAWLEYALELSRVRGYYTLYPSQDTARAILGVHNDISDVPEEYQGDVSKKGTPKDFVDEGNEQFEPASPMDMLETLPVKGKLQALSVGLPLLSWDGTAKSPKELAAEAVEHTALFRREVGGCEEGGDEKSHNPPKFDSADLFCRDTKA